jgi:hypothetical protein
MAMVMGIRWAAAAMNCWRWKTVWPASAMRGADACPGL